MQRRPYPELKEPHKVKGKAMYAPKQRTKDSMSEAQKHGINIWNNWHDVLIANGLMEDKPET